MTRAEIKRIMFKKLRERNHVAPATFPLSVKSETVYDPDEDLTYVHWYTRDPMLSTNKEDVWTRIRSRVYKIKDGHVLWESERMQKIGI